MVGVRYGACRGARRVGEAAGGSGAGRSCMPAWTACQHANAAIWEASRHAESVWKALFSRVLLPVASAAAVCMKLAAPSLCGGEKHQPPLQHAPQPPSSTSRAQLPLPLPSTQGSSSSIITTQPCFCCTGSIMSSWQAPSVRRCMTRQTRPSSSSSTHAAAAASARVWQPTWRARWGAPRCLIWRSTGLRRCSH